jgi:pilus assembly protein Flp/PilA
VGSNPTPSAIYRFATGPDRAGYRGGAASGIAGSPPVYRQLKILAQAPRDRFSETRRIRLRTLLSNLVRDESGVTAIEYALIAALIAVAAIAAFTLVGTNLSTAFSTIAGKV